MTTKSSICPKCKTPLPRDAPKGLCPECLLRGGFEDDDAAESSRSPRGAGERTIHIVVPLDEPSPAMTETIRYFGDYELLEKIAIGGMGVVFKARQMSLNRLVAVKLIRGGQLAREADIHRFRIEAEAAANLKHPNIVAIHEVGEHEDRHFFSMDFIEGRNLAALVRDHPLEPARAARLIQTVAQAIAYAHGRGVLHRDLKPSNVMIDAQDQPHVTDFGLAKLLKSDSELTQTGEVIGSPSYMSPEQARGRGDQVSVRSDVYALGAMLYELLTTRPPFLAATALETMKLVAEREPVAPRTLNPSVPRDLDTICLNCLQKDPAHRFSSALELAEELGRFLRNEPIHARPIAVWEQGLKWAKRHPARAGLVALTFLALAVVIPLLLVMSAKVGRERNHALRQEQAATNALARAEAEANRATDARARTRQSLYAADMAVAFDALGKGDLIVARRALSAHAPAPGEDDLRGFEWRWLWQRAQGEARVSHEAHLAPINSVAWSPDGRWLASGGEDGVVQLWDALGEKLARTLIDSNRVGLVAQFRDSRQMDRAQVLHRYSAVMDEYPHPVRVNSVSFSADNQWLAVGKNLGTQLWDPDTGELVSTLPLPGLIAVFSPTQGNLLAGRRHYRSTNAYFLEIPSGRLVAEWSTGVDAFAFSPDSQWAAEWKRPSRFIRVRHVPDGALRNEWRYGGISVENLAFSPDGRWVAAGDKDSGDIEICEAHDGSLYARIKEQRGRNASLAFSPDGRWLAFGNYDQTITLWDVAEKREARRLHGHRSAALALTFSPDSRRLASGGHDGTVRFWDVTSPAALPVLTDITNLSGVFAFSRDGRHLLTQSRADRGFLATLWELPARQALRSWPADEFSDAVFTAAGEIVTAARGNTNTPPAVRIYPAAWADADPSRADAPNCVTLPLEGIAARCTSSGLSPDGSVCVTGHADGTVAFWGARTGQLQSSHSRQYQHPVDTNYAFAVTRVAFSADGRTVVTVSDEWVILVTWSLPEQRPLARRLFSGTYDLVSAVSPDGLQIAVGGTQQGHTINFWNAGLCESPRQLEGHQDFLYALAFSPDGRTLASGGRDGLLKLWHLPTGRELFTLCSQPHADKFGHVAFSPDGDWLGVADMKGRLHLWHGPFLTEPRRQP